MKTNSINILVVVLWCMGIPSASLLNAETILPRSVDVALQGNGVLIGQVVNAEGQAMTGVPVVLTSRGKEVARCQTGKEGVFQVAGLKGGTFEVAAVGIEGSCRVWAPGTAPPAAQQGLLVVAAGDVVRGQHMGGPVRSGRVQGHGGGLLALMIDHPLVTGAAVGAAIAIPIALSNSGSPSSP